jgi:ATP-dependent Clp protease ATP-binding subunit ClpA
MINAAYNEAKLRNHEYLTPEHILYAALSFEEVQGVLSSCGANTEQIKHGMESYFEQKIPIAPSAMEPTQTVGFQSVIQRAVMHSHSAQKKMVDVADILVSLFDEERNYSAYYLRKAGVERLNLLDILSHGNAHGVLGYAGSRDEDGNMPDDEAEPGQKAKGAKKSALERFAVNLTALAGEGKLEPFIGREA